MTTTLHMGGGFHVYITWNGDNGTDQHDREWIDKSNPKLKHAAHQIVFDNCLVDVMAQLNRVVFMNATTPATEQEKLDEEIFVNDLENVGI